MNLASGRDLRTTTLCQVCEKPFEKRLAGANICGHCQVAMAIVLNYERYLYHRWGVINIGR
jgi:hypothetical protein